MKKIIFVLIVILECFNLNSQTNLVQTIETFYPRYNATTIQSVRTVFSKKSGLTFVWNPDNSMWIANGVCRLPDTGDGNADPFLQTDQFDPNYAVGINQCGSAIKSIVIPPSTINIDLKKVIFKSYTINSGNVVNDELTYAYDYFRSCFVEQTGTHKIPYLNSAFKSTRQFDGYIRNFGLSNQRVISAGGTQNNTFEKRSIYNGLFYNWENKSLQVGVPSYQNWRASYPFTRQGCTYGCDTTLYSNVRTGTPDYDYLYRMQNYQMKMRNGERLRIAIFGDSNLEVDGRLYNSFVAKLEQFKTVGGIYWNGYNTTNTPARFTQSATGTVTLQDNSPTNNVNAQFVGGYRTDMNTSATLTIQPTGYKTGTVFNQIKIVTVNSATATIDVSVNGTTVVTNQSVASSFVTTTLNFTASESPTLLLRCATGTLRVIGIYFINNVASNDVNYVDIYNYSNTATKLIDYTDTGTFTNLCNTNQLPSNIDCFLINYGSNDFGYITGNEQKFQSDIAKFCNKLKSCYTNSPDICLIASAHPDGTIGSLSNGQQTITHENYTNVLYSTANYYGYGFINLFNLIPNWREFYNKAWSTDYIHYSGNGGKVGELLFETLSTGIELIPPQMPQLGYTLVTTSGAIVGNTNVNWERVNFSASRVPFSSTNQQYGDWVKVYVNISLPFTSPQAANTQLFVNLPVATTYGNFTSSTQAFGSLTRCFASSPFSAGTDFDTNHFDAVYVGSRSGFQQISITIPPFNTGKSNILIQGFFLYKL